MKASNKRLFILLGSAALILAVFIIFVVLLQPEYANIQQLRGLLASSNNTYNAASQNVDYVNNLYEKNKIDINQMQDSLKSAVPDQQKVADVVNQIQGIASANNLPIESINLETLPIQQSKANTSLVKGYGVLRVTLKMSGTYPSFKQFLNLLETNVRIMDARTLRIYQVDPINKSIFNFELVVDTYYQIIK